MTSLLAMVPRAAYRWLALAALALALVAFGWVKGAQHGEARLQAAEARALKEGARITVLRQGVTERVALKFAPQLTRIEVVTETIVKEVPVYVPSDAPALPGGFRVLHDASAAGRVPDSAGIADAAAVPAATAAETLALNYGACLRNAKQLEGLQEWVREQGKVR